MIHGPSRTSFLLTASVDGHLKFWKKKDPNDDDGDSAAGVGIEYVISFFISPTYTELTARPCPPLDS